MSEGTSAAVMPMGAVQGEWVRKPSVAGMVGLSLLLLLPGGGNIVASAVRVMDHDAPRAAPYAFALLSTAGLAGFVVLLVQLAAIRRGEAAAGRKLLVVPAGVAGLAAACALLVSTSVSMADKSWVRLAVIAPGVAWAGVLLTITAFALAFIAVARGRTKVFDERGVTALLLGIVLYAGCGLLVGTRFSDELVLWTLFPSAAGVVAMTMLASSGPFDEDASEETRRRAWWVIGLALGGVGSAVATSWLLERSGGGMPGSHAEALTRSNMALGCAWLLLLPVGASAASSCRQHARTLLVLLGLAWMVLLLVAHAHMRPFVPEEEAITPLWENPSATAVLGGFAIAGVLGLLAVPSWMRAQSGLASWWIAVGAPALTVLGACGLHAIAPLAKVRSDEGQRVLQAELWRLQGFWAVGAAGLLLLCTAVAVLGLRASARSESGRAGWRGALAFVGGFVSLIALTIACALWTSLWSGAHASVTLSLGPCAVGLVSIYLGARVDDEHASVDVLLATVASLAGIGMAIVSSEARLDLEVLFAAAERGRNDSMLTLLAPEVAPWLLVIPVLGASLVVMSAPGRWQAARKKWKVIAGAALACLLAVGCLSWLESSAEQRVMGRGRHAIGAGRR